MARWRDIADELAGLVVEGRYQALQGRAVRQVRALAHTPHKDIHAPRGAWVSHVLSLEDWPVLISWEGRVPAVIRLLSIVESRG